MKKTGSVSTFAFIETDPFIGLIPLPSFQPMHRCLTSFTRRLFARLPAEPFGITGANWSQPKGLRRAGAMPCVLAGDWIPPRPGSGKA